MQTRYSLGLHILIILVSLGINIKLWQHPVYQSFPDFSHYATLAARRHAFQQYLLPKIEDANNGIELLRQHLLTCYQRFLTGHPLSDSDLYWLNSLFLSIQKTQIEQTSFWETLLDHVDIVPESLIFKQATKIEQSNRVVSHHNIFQLVCKSQDCNPPLRRYANNITRMHLLRVSLAMRSSTSLYLAAYGSRQAAISDYLLLLNSSPAFASFRQWRHRQRAQHLPDDQWPLSPSIEALINPDRIHIPTAYDPSKRV